MCPPDPPVPDTAGELTIRSGVAEFAHYVDGHRVAVDDGTPGSGAVGWILLVGFVLAAVTLVVSHLTFGPRDVYLPGVSSAKQIPAMIVVACLVLIAVFLAAATWHSLNRAPVSADPSSNPTQAAFILAPPSAQIASSPLLVLVLASAAGIGLLVSFGTVNSLTPKQRSADG